MTNTLEKLLKVEQLSSASRFRRLLYHPLKYTLAIGYRTFLYPLIKRGCTLSTSTFFNWPISISLPASTDIYLTGGKSDPSEIRLAKLMIRHLAQGDCFIDVGAHYGYFTLLGAYIIGNSGSVFSFEPSMKTFRLLQNNCVAYPQIKVFNAAVSDSNDDLVFYEFPTLYSEYSTSAIQQFEKQVWFLKNQPIERKVSAICLDQLIQAEHILPKMIKIDVEGAELSVIKGTSTFLALNNCLLVMEYLNQTRHNEGHQAARELLFQLGFSSFLITDKGELSPIKDIDIYLTEKGIESENIVFRKTV